MTRSTGQEMTAIEKIVSLLTVLKRREGSPHHAGPHREAPGSVRG